MQSLYGSIRLARNAKPVGSLMGPLRIFTSRSSPLVLMKPTSDAELFSSFRDDSLRSTALLSFYRHPSSFNKTMVVQNISSRSISTSSTEDSVAHQASVSIDSPRIKFKRLDKTARHIMQILDKEAVEEVRGQREIPDIQPGHIIQLKVEVPENKRRVSILKGIVIARRNAGINTTFRLRRLVAGVGIESLFPLYSPNIKEIKVLDKKKVRRAKLYYLRDRMNPLKK